jgi:hypothetical protein
MGEGHTPCVKDLSVLGLSDYNIESLTVDHGKVFNTWSMALSHHFTHNGRWSDFLYYNLTAPGRKGL